MSAFICSDRQFVAVVAAYNAAQPHPLPAAQLQELANLLKRENIRSVNWRYNERTRFEPVQFEQTAIDIGTEGITTAMAIQLANCIDYQSCERDDYEKSKAFALINRIRLALYEKQFGETVNRQSSGVWSI
jgi:hypothetical protein